MMNEELRFDRISAARQRIIRLCESIKFGSIENLVIQDAEPVLNECGALVHIDIKLDRVSAFGAVTSSSEFVLSGEFQRLMSLFDAVRDGCISKIEIRDGLPRRVVCEQRLANQDIAEVLTNLALL